MWLTLGILVAVFITLLVFNVPVAYCMGVATTVTMLITIDLPPILSVTQVAQTMATSLNSFSLLAIPFFVLSGLLMGHGGIARRLIDFASALVGRFKGGLAFVNILTCMFFGSISGSAAAAVSSIGGVMVPLMEEKKYSRDFSAAITVTAATTGLLIPPSNVMIIYSVAAGVSVAKIFIAGIIPGILVGLGLMVCAGFMSIKENYGQGESCGFGETFKAFLGALPALFLIVIVLGGILSGTFTATEASAIAVVYSFLLSVVFYREVKMKAIPKILIQSAVTTSVVMLLIATSMAMSELLTGARIPQELTQAMLGLTDNKILIMLLINVLLLFVGTFMDMTPAILVFTPILLPVVEKLGVHPLHFGIIMIMNLCIGLCTPPVGTCLFLGCGVANTTVSRMMKYLIPCFISMIVVLLLTTYCEGVSMWLPGLLDSAKK